MVSRPSLIAFRRMLERLQAIIANPTGNQL
jgi:hypothetical protein